MQVCESTVMMRGILEQLRDIYVREGLIRGLYKGFAMNFFKVAPARCARTMLTRGRTPTGHQGPIAFGVSFMLNDAIKLLLVSRRMHGVLRPLQ